jgi:hypothetical protein
MASSYVNDLRLNEMATGDASGTWGETTNTNLELIAEAFSYGTEAITTNADTHTTTIADGATDPGRALYLKYTGTLDSACTITIGPNTVSKVWIIENGTSGSQDIILSQGSGANITIPAGDTKVVYSDGAGAGAAFFDAFASLSVVDLKVQDDLTVTDAALVTGVLTTTATQVATGGITSGSDIISDTDSTDSLGSTGVRWLKGWFDTLTAGTLTVGSGSVTDSSGAISFGDENLTTTGIVTAAGTSVFTNLDISGDIDVDGTTNLDVVDIDGAVDMASTLAVAGVLTGASLDISGNVDVDGTTETDVLTINGSQFNYKAFGTDSIMIGDTTTGTIDAADRNTGLGVDVFADLTTGDDNTGVGKGALNANTTGNNNTGVGRAALGNNTTASNNTAVGYYALLANTEGGTNTAVGSSAMFTNTTGEQNTVLGHQASYSNTTGSANVVMGLNTMYYNTTGSSNVALGRDALQSNTTADNNTAVGKSALFGNTTGSENTAVGTSALVATTTGDKNVALGDSAGYSNTTGTSNVFLGNGAGYNTTGSGNTFVGGSTSGTYYPAGYLVTSGANNTIIGGYNGNEGSLDIRTSSNNIVLSDGDGNPRVHITSSGSMRQLANAGVVGLALAQATTSDSDNAIRYHRNSDITHSGDVRFVVFSSGNVQNTNNSYAGISDEKLKDNITDATPKLEKLKQVKVRSYNFKDEPDFKQIGVVAQELETVFPNLVETIDDQDMGLTKSVKYSVFVPILIKAIQEQQTIIESLTARITTLEG